MIDVDKTIRDAQAVLIAAQGAKIQALEAEVRMLRKMLTDATDAAKRDEAKRKAVA